MTSNLPTVSRPRRVLAARRLVLLASVAGLGAAVLFAGPGTPQVGLPSFPAIAHAETAQRPVGFADIVEKVKPAVISVRVKMDAGTQMSEFGGDDPFGPNSPFQYFFRRFGQEMPGQGPGLRGGPRRHFATGQGSGFFISADGYAVTNNRSE